MMSNKFDKFKIRGIENQKKANMMFYYIITDAEKTEKYFFEGLKKSLPKEKQNRLCIKVVQNQTNKLIEKALELQQEPGNKRKIIIVFDRDQVKNFDKIIDKAKKTGFIEVAWSNPCFEIFFMGYFGSVSKAQNSTQTISEFNKMYYESTNKKYKKMMKKFYIT